MFRERALAIASDIATQLDIEIPWLIEAQITQEERFKTWLAELTLQSDVSPSQEAVNNLKAWIDQFSEEELKAFVSKLAIYCKAVGIELAWLLKGQLFYEELRHAAQEIVLFYLLSRLKGRQTKQEGQEFKMYLAFNKNPKKHAAFGQHFYEALLHKGLVPELEPEQEPLQITKRRDRNKMMKEIRQAAIDQPVAFHLLLKIVVQEIQANRLTLLTLE